MKPTNPRKEVRVLYLHNHTSLFCCVCVCVCVTVTKIPRDAFCSVELKEKSEKIIGQP